MIIVVTGHRPKGKLWDIYDLYHPLYLEIAREMRTYLLEAIKNLKEDEVLTLVTGMALGIDTLFALVGLKLKKEFPGKVRLFCMIPCKGHSKKWNKEDRKRYNEILSQADREEYSSQAEYSNYMTMYKRDEDMVDLLNKEEGYVLSVWNGFKSGGTFHTVDYAEQNEKIVHNINPLKYSYLVLFQNESDIEKFREYIKSKSKQSLTNMLSLYEKAKKGSIQHDTKIDFRIEILKGQINII
jgi:Uncharacterized protein conserved in bacteria